MFVHLFICLFISLGTSSTEAEENLPFGKGPVKESKCSSEEQERANADRRLL